MLSSLVGRIYLGGKKRKEKFDDKFHIEIGQIRG